MSILSAILLFFAIPALTGWIGLTRNFERDWAPSAWIEYFVEVAIITAFVLSLTGVR